MAKLDVVAVTGKYTTKDGTEKNRYMKIGIVIDTKNGQMLKLEAVPVGWDGWAYLNEPKEREQAEKPQNVRRSSAETAARMSDMTDDIPFASRGARNHVE